MVKKMYSAFISSVYESLQDERATVIDSLLDFNTFPICMEHFTVSTSGKFADIEALIDSCDFFILILGRHYGSCDAQGVSWTEREYDYAAACGKPILALVCPELTEIGECDESTLTEAERKQLAFWDKISFARVISHRLPITKILGQFFQQVDFDKCVGWIRNEAERPMSENDLRAWREAHAAYDLAGTWYHVHLSVDDMTYIRTGTLQITQQFDPEHYQTLLLDGLNYSARYDAEKQKISENVLKRSHWNGTYTLSDNGAAFGIFHSKREFSGTFNGQNVDRGTRRGIHDFVIDVSKNQRVEWFHGEFHDEAPSPKIGIIYVFRTEQARLEFLEENFKDVLLSIH